jgi:NADH-quinone oxidoreductase subunit G
MADDVTLTIDGVKVSVPKGTLLVEAAKQAQTPEIPVYCYHEKLGPAGLCRVCLVEVVGMPKLQIACYTQVSEGMVVNTINSRATEGRRAIMEMFLLNHPLDCPICDKGGECSLQDYSVAYGQDASRTAEPKESKPKAVDLGPTIVLDEERCIVCQRCVRFEKDITREEGLVVMDRGSHDIIATATDGEYHSDFTGNVTELCPVGALTSKTYRFKARPWDNHITASSCAQCSVGCAQTVHVRHGAISRTMSVITDTVSDGWLCDRGRYSVSFIKHEKRLRTPLYRHNGNLIQVSWDDAISIWANALKGAGDGSRIAAIGGGRLTNEENYLYQHIMRKLGSANLDWRTGRQMQAVAGSNAGTLVELETAQVIVTAGIPPSQNAPIMDLRVRKAVTRHGAQLISVGPFGAGSFVPETRCTDVAAAIKALPQELKTVAVIWDGIDAELGVQLEKLINEITGRGGKVLRYIAGDVPNARGAEAMGMHPNFTPHFQTAPQAGLDINGILEAARKGNIAALSIMGANPVLTAPNGEAVRAALKAIPFIAVSELFATETTEYATLILPAASAYERSGYFTNLEGAVQAINVAIDAPDGVLADGDMLVALADMLEIKLPSPEAVEAAATKATTEMSLASITFGESHICAKTTSSRAAGDLRIAIAHAIFAGSGTLAHDDQISATLRSKPTAKVSPATAAKIGVIGGSVIDLTAGSRSLKDLKVAIEPALEDGWIAILDGLSEAPANIFASGEPIGIENIRGGRQLAGSRS